MKCKKSNGRVGRAGVAFASLASLCLIWLRPHIGGLKTPSGSRFHLVMIIAHHRRHQYLYILHTRASEIIARGRSTPSSPAGTPGPRSPLPRCPQPPQPSAGHHRRSALVTGRRWSRASPRPRACASPPARPPRSTGGRPRATWTGRASAARWWRRALACVVVWWGGCRCQSRLVDWSAG